MIGIIITAYNRADSLKNLLKSLSDIKHHPQIEELPLIISIDNSGTAEVNRVAEDFIWNYGPKEVVIHKEKKGLVKHFIWVGEQTSRFDQVIFLEDDLYVSPEILFFVKPMIDYYEDKDEVAAAALYNPVLIEATGTKFYQIEDGNDVFFIQHPYWGNVWFKNKWIHFHSFLENYKEPDNSILPPNIAAWDRSFKKIFIQFLIKTKRTVVYPRISMVTNNGDAGIHSGDLFEYQSNLEIGKRDYKFTDVANSLAIYDAFFEIEPTVLKKLNPILSDYNFECDLNGTRQNYMSPYVLTTKPVKQRLMSFTSLMKPMELGVVFNIEGNSGIALSAPKDISNNLKSYLRKRRYLDIRKNYHIGIVAASQITIHLIRELYRYFIAKLKI